MKIKNYLSSLAKPGLLASIEAFLFYSLLFFLPTQFGKHFWPEFSYVMGLRIDYLSPTLYFTDILVALVFVSWLTRRLRASTEQNSKLKTQNSKLQFKNKISIKQSHILIPFFVISYLLLVIGMSGGVWGGLYYLLKFLEMAFVAYYTAKFMASTYAFKNAALVFAGGLLFQSVLAVAQFVRQGSVGGLLYFFGERSFAASTPGIANASLNGELVLRPYGTLPHPNVLAGYLLVAMAVVLFCIKSTVSKKILFLQYVSLLLGSIALSLSMSRIAIVLWGVMVLYYFSKKLKKKMITALLVGMALLFLVTPLGSRFTGVRIADEAISQRVVLAQAAMDMIASSPLLGVGLSSFIPSLAAIQQPLTASTFLQPVHNIFLLIAAETGLIGLGLFVLLLWKTYRRIMNYEAGIREPILIIFGAILITGLFDHYWLTLQQGQLLFAFVIGACWISRRKRTP